MMSKEEYEEIKKGQSELKDLPNSTLVNFMDKLSTDFELVKQSIIQQTIYLDELEMFYNKTLDEYQSRGI
jgi:hypothetical protein